jgi:polar amino acid transport system permease protein
MDALLEQFFDIGIMVQAAPLILRGFGTTLLLCAIVIPLGLAGGLGTALLGLAPSRWVRWPVIAAVDFFRAVPPLVLLIFVYAGLPFAGLRLTPLQAVAIAFFLNTSSYYGEIFRAGLESVGGGQWEAARSTGLTARQTLTSVILPQAVRNVLPDLLSNTVEAVKLTSIASVVALPELLYSADMARSLTYNASPLVMAGALYLALLWPIGAPDQPVRAPSCLSEARRRTAAPALQIATIRGSGPGMKFATPVPEGSGEPGGLGLRSRAARAVRSPSARQED